MSVTALVGTNAQFHCAGTGSHMVWEVDGLAPDHPNIISSWDNYSISTILRHNTVQPHCTSNISEQWYYCTMCDQCITVQYTSNQQLLYSDSSR